MKPCFKPNCDLTLKKLGHTTTSLKPQVENRLSSKMQIKNLKGGFGKNSDLAETPVILHSSSTPTTQDGIRYVDLEGTNHINKPENYDFLTKDIKDNKLKALIGFLIIFYIIYFRFIRERLIGH